VAKAKDQSCTALIALVSRGFAFVTNLVVSTAAKVQAAAVLTVHRKGKGSPYSITKRRVLELIPVLGSQSAGDVSHKPIGRLPLLSAMPTVTLTTLERAATSFAAW